METPAWTIRPDDGPLVAAAIHNGHDVRDELLPWLALGETDRLYEEDPYTGVWAEMIRTCIVVHRSRFEVDLNRPPEKAVYRSPEDAWGLRVWRETPAGEILRRSRQMYETFYREVEVLLDMLVARHGRVVVLDLHSYNHRRDKLDGRAAPSATNPTINLGTSNMDLDRWGGVVEQFERSLQSVFVQGQPLDVRRNVKFRGGHFPRWIHQTYPESICALAIEVKKIFMDEWTGRLDEQVHAALGEALVQASANAMAWFPRGSRQP